MEFICIGSRQHGQLSKLCILYNEKILSIPIVYLRGMKLNIVAKALESTSKKCIMMKVQFLHICSEGRNSLKSHVIQPCFAANLSFPIRQISPSPNIPVIQ